MLVNSHWFISAYLVPFQIIISYNVYKLYVLPDTHCGKSITKQSLSHMSTTHIFTLASPDRHIDNNSKIACISIKCVFRLAYTGANVGISIDGAGNHRRSSTSARAWKRMCETLRSISWSANAMRFHCKKINGVLHSCDVRRQLYIFNYEIEIREMCRAFHMVEDVLEYYFCFLLLLFMDIRKYTVWRVLALQLPHMPLRVYVNFYTTSVFAARMHP